MNIHIIYYIQCTSIYLYITSMQAKEITALHLFIVHASY